MLWFVLLSTHMQDHEVAALIRAEKKRQKRVINLIASENYVSKDVLQSLGSEFTNKYAEGYSDNRYYRGNEVVDELENLTKERALKVFGLGKNSWHVNVQALSGSPANLAVYHALIKPGAKIMALDLGSGGHLSHGHKITFSGTYWKQVPYFLNHEELLDYDQIKHLARKQKPALIVAGYSAYSRTVDWKKFREIADSVGALLLCDISHIAGLVAGKEHVSPFRFADVVTTTTHKTLRGPRGALIYVKKDQRKLDEAIDRAVFPGLQGGPHMNQVAAIAVALYEAAQPEFSEYAAQVVRNAAALAEALRSRGWRLVSGGTDNHIVMADVWRTIGMGGDKASRILEAANIIVNKNMIPFDERGPRDPSGIRLGTAAETTRGATEADMVKIADKIDKALRSS